MTIDDYSGGIILDPSPENRPMNSAEEMLNYDVWKGHLIKRRGTTAKTFALRGSASTIPAATETVIQVELLDAPMAKEDSLKGPWPNLIVYPGAGDITTFFHNQPAVTVVLVKITDEVGTGKQNRYRIYADHWQKDYFDLVQYGTATYFYSIDADTVPFIIPRKNGCAIGGVYIDKLDGTTEKGVLWFGHVKKQWGWSRSDGGGGTNLATYGYMGDFDAWILVNSECYDCESQIKLRLGISSLESLYRAGSAENDEIDKVGGTMPPAKTVLERHFDRIVLGGETGPVRLRLKTTAVFDWYQESRPLRFDDALYELLAYESITPSVSVGTAKLPYLWKIKAIDEGRGVEIDLGKRQEIFTALNCDLEQLQDFDDEDGDLDYIGVLSLRWRWPYDKNETNRYHGENVPLYINGDAPAGATNSHGTCWSVEWDDNFTTIEKLVLRPNYFPWGYISPFDNIGGSGIYRNGTFLDPGKASGCWPWMFLMYLIGAPITTAEGDDTSGFDDGAYWVHHAWFGWTDLHGTFHQGAKYIIDSLPSANNRREWLDYFDVVNADVDDAPLTIPDGHEMSACLQLDGGSFLLGTFGQDEDSGRALCFIKPYFPTTHLLEDNTWDNIYKVGLKRLTSFRHYMMEPEVDADYRLVSETHLDENPYDLKHHGVDYEILGDVPFHMQEGPDIATGIGDAPVWMMGMIGPEVVLMPSFYPSVNRYLTGEGLIFKAFVHDKFIMSNEKVRTKEGTAILSQQLLRDESKRDAPMWARGSVCTKRILGPNMKTGQVQYSLIAGGIPQWDICPGDIDIDMNDTVIHVVTWRGNHHLVFTDNALWRINMGTSDELTWQIMNTFWQSGTVLWHTIQVTPQGVFFVNDEGVWLYMGDLPVSLLEGRWQKLFDAYYTDNLTVTGAHAGYNKREKTIYFVPGITISSLQYVWLFDITAVRWRRYLYASGRPYYMTYHDKQFLLSAAAGDCWRTDYASFIDKAAGYTCLWRSQPVQNGSAVHHEHITHLGIDYLHASTLDAIARVRPLQGEYDEKALTAMPKVRIPNSRRHYFFPLPIGMGRLLQIEVGQGTWFADANSTEAFEIRNISLRGSAREQWDQTNDGDVGIPEEDPET